jgi:hemerythrin
MGKFEWKESYGVGIRVLDYQHKKFLSMLAELERMLGDSDLDAEHFEDLLLDFIDYTHVHFVLEEELMEAYEFPERKEHYRMHSNFVEKIQDCKKDCLDMEKRDIVAIFTFLKNWFYEHIVQDDKDLGQYLQKIGLH